MTREAKVPRSDRRETTREQILVAATELLAEHGYAALRVAAVAKEAGVSLGGYLHHFPSKELLVVAVLERLSARVMSIAEQDALQKTGEKDLFEQIARGAQRFYASREFLIYLDIFLSVRRHTFVGDTAIALTTAQRSATEALWVPRVTAQGVAAKDAVLIIRALWGLARGLAISSSEDFRSSQWETMKLVIEALRKSHLETPSSSNEGRRANGSQLQKTAEQIESRSSSRGSTGTTSPRRGG